MAPHRGTICTIGIPSRGARRLHKQQIIVPQGIDEISEWHNGFVLVPKVNGKVRLFSGLARCNKALIRPVHGSPTFNDILASRCDMPHTN